MIRGETIKPMSITELIAVISLFIAMTSFLFNLGIFETVRTRKGLDVQAFKPISLIIGVTYITFPIVGIVIKKQVTTTHMEKITLLTLYNVFIFIVLYIIYITFNKKFVAKKKQIFESNDVYVPSKKESDIYFVCSMLLIRRDTGTGQLSQSSDWFLGERDRIERSCLSFFFCYFESIIHRTY